jgi:hypothetical protein
MTQDGTMIEAGQRFIVDAFRPPDAEGVTRLFRTVYGDGYPVKLVYDPQELIQAFEKGENIPIVARTPKGDIVGYVALYRSSPNPRLYEGGQGLVLASYRGEGIAPQLMQYSLEVLIPRLGIDAIFGESVCNHTHMQKSMTALGAVETALEVDLMPAEAYSTEKSASGRVAAIVSFKFFVPNPHTVYIPHLYQAPLDYIYSLIDEPRAFVISREKVPPAAKTELSTRIFDFAKVARIAASSAGPDFVERIIEREEELFSLNTVVIQVWLPLGCPWVGEVVASLRERGYFFGGALPRWFGDDGLLMQKIVGQPNWDGIQLYTDRAKRMLEFIRKDWEMRALL